MKTNLNLAETKFYYRGKEILPKDSRNLPWREEVFVSFDKGTTLKSLHRDVNAIKTLLDNNVIDYSYVPYCPGFLFIETVQASDPVDSDVLTYLLKEGKKRKIKLDLNGLISLTEHPSTLKWFLKKGVKCKKVSGYGPSTMEPFIWKYESGYPYALQMISMLKEHHALDKKYLSKHKEEMSLATRFAFGIK